MTPQTHQVLDPDLCGRLVSVARNRAVVEFHASQVMAADERGLVHGGFLFGLADHAAMLAVNVPTVVLGSADVRFMKPVVVGDSLLAEAQVKGSDGRKRTVEVVVRKGTEPVMSGTFTCLVPDKHVLDR